MPNLTPTEVLTYLMGEKPLSIVRAGDGEKLILECMTTVAALEQANNAVLRRQLGFSPNLDDIKEIRDNLLIAYHGADIIGIPMHKNIERLGKHWNGVLLSLDEHIPKHTDKYCSTDIGYDMLNDGLFDHLLTSRKRLYYISCRDLDEGFKSRYNIPTVCKYTIAPEKKFTSGYEGEPHWPTQFNHAYRWMTVMEPKGRLLLVGAGVVGKVYCQWWKDMGGIAFDVGSVMDEWGGFITRGPDKGLDKIDLDSKFKL